MFYKGPSLKLNFLVSTDTVSTSRLSFHFTSGKLSWQHDGTSQILNVVKGRTTWIAALNGTQPTLSLLKKGKNLLNQFVVNTDWCGRSAGAHGRRWQRISLQHQTTNVIHPLPWKRPRRALSLDAVSTNMSKKCFIFFWNMEQINSCRIIIDYICFLKKWGEFKFQFPIIIIVCKNPAIQGQQ